MVYGYLSQTSLSTHDRYVPVLYYNINVTFTMAMFCSLLSTGILKSVQTILPNRLTQDMGPRCGPAMTSRRKSSKHSWVFYYQILIMANMSITLPRLTFLQRDARCPWGRGTNVNRISRRLPSQQRLLSFRMGT